MSNTTYDSYESFWRKLKLAYPLSKGSIMPPIATTVAKEDPEKVSDLLENLEQIVQNLLNQYGDKESAIKRAEENGDVCFMSLITEDFSGIIRFDCVVDEISDSYKILEINCDYPDGLLLHDYTYSALTNTNTRLHHRLLRKLFKEEGPTYVLHDKDAEFLDAYELERVFLKAQRGSEVHNSVKVRRCIETSKMTSDMYKSLTATSSNRVVNSFALRTLGYKGLLANITSDLIPTTYLLNSDSKQKIIDNKDTLILKPQDGCEGNDIYFGYMNKLDDWRKIVEDFCTKNYVAQEFIQIKKQKVDLFENNSIVEKDLYYDLCPHFFIDKGRVIGRGHILMRYSEDRVVNVSKGGGIGYYKLSEIV